MRLIDVTKFIEENPVLPSSVLVALSKAPAIDAVPRIVLDQVRWERDIAMEQLKEHGIPFGGKADDVAKVVRCKDCMFWKPTGSEMGNSLEDMEPIGGCRYVKFCRKASDFCSFGEPKMKT